MKSALKHSKTSEKEITSDELLAADGFNPCELPFTLGWENYDKLKAFYNLKDDETTTILLAMVGPSEEGRKFWSKFKVPFEMFDGNVLKVPKSAPADNSKNVAGHEKFSPVDKNVANMTALPAAVSATGKKRSSLDETSSTAIPRLLWSNVANVLAFMVMRRLKKNPQKKNRHLDVFLICDVHCPRRKRWRIWRWKVWRPVRSKLRREWQLLGGSLYVSFIFACQAVCVLFFSAMIVAGPWC